MTTFDKFDNLPQTTFVSEDEERWGALGVEAPVWGALGVQAPVWGALGVEIRGGLGVEAPVLGLERPRPLPQAEAAATV